MVSQVPPDMPADAAELYAGLLLASQRTDLPRLADLLSDPALLAAMTPEHVRRLEVLKAWLTGLDGLIREPDARTADETARALKVAGRRLRGARKWMIAGALGLITASSLMAAGVGWTVSSQRHEARISTLETRVVEVNQSIQTLTRVLLRKNDEADQLDVDAGGHPLQPVHQLDK
jgi:hypothetical protein